MVFLSLPFSDLHFLEESSRKVELTRKDIHKFDPKAANFRVSFRNMTDKYDHLFLEEWLHHHPSIFSKFFFIFLNFSAWNWDSSDCRHCGVSSIPGLFGGGGRRGEAFVWQRDCPSMHYDCMSMAFPWMFGALYKLTMIIIVTPNPNTPVV